MGRASSIRPYKLCFTDGIDLVFDCNNAIGLYSLHGITGRISSECCIRNSSRNSCRSDEQKSRTDFFRPLYCPCQFDNCCRLFLQFIACIVGDYCAGSPEYWDSIPYPSNKCGGSADCPDGTIDKVFRLYAVLTDNRLHCRNGDCRYAVSNLEHQWHGSPRCRRRSYRITCCIPY